MKKIILAVASVLALGLLASCKQQIEGSLNVTATNYNKSLDAQTTKNYFYKVTGTVTTTTTSTSQYKAAGASSQVYTSQELTTVKTFTPSSDASVNITENPLTNVVTYDYYIPYTAEIVATGTAYSNISGVANTTIKHVYNKNRTGNYGASEFTGTLNYKIYKIDGKFYLNDKAKDGSEIIVSEGFDPLAATVALSKFSDTTSVTDVSATWVADTTANLNTNVPTSDWTTKTTTVTGGKVSTLSLEKR